MKILYAFLFITYTQLYAFGDNHITVSLDGTGDYTSIQDAVTACGAFSKEQKTIYIKNGVYKEKILIDSFHSNIKIIGENKEKTIILNGDYAGQKGIGTFTSYTLKILGDNIQIKNLTIENNAGKVGQAVALHIEGDYFIAENCQLLGNQDTLYASGHKSRQYFKNCFISGTTDFVFGSATAIFYNCEIYSKANSFITAANTSKEKKFGFVFIKCNLTADSNVNKVYLGRPWRSYAKVVFLNCYMGKHIAPEGWHNWDKPEREKTSVYAEYNNKGEGANSNKRVDWSNQLTKRQAKVYNVEQIFKIESAWDIEVD